MLRKKCKHQHFQQVSALQYQYRNRPQKSSISSVLFEYTEKSFIQKICANLLLKRTMVSTAWWPSGNTLFPVRSRNHCFLMIFIVDHGIWTQATEAADSQFLSLLTPPCPLTPPTEYYSSKPPHRSFLNIPPYFFTSTPPAPSLRLSFIAFTHSPIELHEAGVSGTYQSLSSILSKRNLYRCVHVCVNTHSVERTECEVKRVSLMCVGKCVFTAICVRRCVQLTDQRV